MKKKEDKKKLNDALIELSNELDTSTDATADVSDSVTVWDDIEAFLALMGE